MGYFSVDRKLELLQQIRARHQRDRNDIIRREKILYGKTGDYYSADENLTEESFDDELQFNSLPLRIMMAVGLFLLIVICDMSGKSFMGIETAQCFSAISEDYESSVTAWVNSAQNPPAGSRP